MKKESIEEAYNGPKEDDDDDGPAKEADDDKKWWPLDATWMNIL